MADRRLLTDRFLKALPPAPRGQRVEVFDARLPGFGIRISDTKDADPARRGKAGRITFVLFTRFAPGAAPTRRVIGIYGAITLEEARRTAGEWRSLIAKGIDPAVIEAEAREKAARERALRIRHSFATVAEAFITDKLAQERSGKMVERDFRSIFIAAWGDRPISEITTLDVLEIINAKKRTAPQMARALLILIKRFFNWAIDQHVYGLTASPCDRLSRAKIIGEPPSRSRRLTDAELFAFWRATGRMKYPIGPVYRMLLLTGLRLNEAAQAVVAGSPRRHHHHPGGADEGQEWQGARTSGAVVVGGAGGHRVAAALSRAGRTCSRFKRGQAASGDDRPDQARSGPAHAADAQGDGPPSRRGSPRRHAAELGQPRSAPRRSLRSVGTARPAQRRGSRACAQAARHRRRL